jgi:hypothetical protein
MRIERFEDIDPPAVWRIEAWQLHRELTHRVYSLTKKGKFACNFGLKGQIQDAPALPFEVSSSTCWLTSKVNEKKATLNGEP